MNFCGQSHTKANLAEGQQGYYFTYSREDKEVHTFPNGICTKVEIIVLLEFEVAYFEAAVLHFSHYTTRTL